ncbi:MAG: ABC transporter permease [Bryobacteraceae bacterium]|nr:ABC transporter permease [Bryobacteraceae bacterium]
MEARRVEEGLPPEEAQRVTGAEYGPRAVVIEEVRDSRPEAALKSVVQDVRYAARQMRRNPGFAAVAVLSLGLGIGANTAIYSLMESILMRSLPVADPESLVLLNWTSRPPQDAGEQWEHVVHGIQGRFWPGDRGALVTGIFPYAAFETIREENPVFSTVFGYFDGMQKNLAVGGQAVSASTEYVSGGYFRGLGVTPAAGRLIGEEDDRAGAEPVAVISYALSQQRLGGPQGAVGQSILVDKVAMTVVGVTPQGFFGVDPAEAPDLYLPLRTIQLVDADDSHSLFQDQNFYWLEMMGRLRPGVSMEQAQAALAPRFNHWVASTATTEGERAKLPALLLNPGAGGLGSLRREYSKPLYVLLAMVALILAITCANTANLLLARASARRREMAIRLSLGAGRRRVVRQLLTESVMLASFGGVLGVMFAVWGVRVLTWLFSRGQENFTLHAEMNWHVLGVTAALTLVCGLLFGLVPAIQATRTDIIGALRGGRGGGTRHRLQHFLVAAQIAMSFVILAAAGMFVQTLNKLHSVELGYARENVLLFTVNARQAGHRDPEIATFYLDLRRRLEAIPGVSSASLAHASIISAGHAGKTYRGPVRIGAVAVEGARVLSAGPRFHSTMQIPMLMGREIDDRDQPGSPAVAVISERLARTYFGSENPIGRRITFVGEKRDLEIVGVSGNLRGRLKDESPMVVFAAASQSPQEGMTYALRTAGDPMGYVQSVRGVVREADATIPVTNVVTQAAEIDRTINREIMFARLCTGFAALALLMACVGLYGTMSYSVERQFGEMGIRMALGARQGEVVWMVLRRVLVLAAAGLAISVPASLAAAQIVKSFLYGTEPNDPGTMAMAAAVLLCAALAAGYWPARRASRIDPLVALRHE